MEQPWTEFYEEELKFQQETDELGDIPEAEASYYSVYGYLPGAFHFGIGEETDGKKVWR